MSVNVSRPEVSRRSYTAVGSFGLAFFTYNYGLNPQTLVEQGVLTAVGTAADCPPGRILYENGKKIVPPQGNFPPILTDSPVNGTNTLTSYMVGVFDPQSGLSGFIDPNSINFAINSTDKPVYLNVDAGRGPSTYVPNSGNPVVTYGSVLSLSQNINNAPPLPSYVGIAASGVDWLNFGNNNANGIFDGPYALAINNGSGSDNYGLATGEGGNLNNTNWAGMYSSGNVYFTGNLFVKRAAGTITLLNGSATLNNVLNSDNVNPLVFLTYKIFSHAAGNSTPGVLTYSFNGNNLTVYSTNPNDTSVVNWFVVNDGIDV